MRKSSINFEQVNSINRALAHAHRNEESEPTYLLPKAFRLSNFIVKGSGNAEFLREHFAMRKSVMTGQARARGSSPFWEGVMVLPEIEGDLEVYKARQEARLQRWALAYQKETKHAVLHICVHLDEGYVGEGGKPIYNPHAHVIVDRLDSNGRVIKLERAQLSRVQDLTSETMEMERGETLAQREGKRGRKHMGHHEYRRYAAAKREAEQSYELGVDHGADVVAIDARVQAQRAVEASERRGAYLELRGFLKGSGKASQAHYSELKRLYEQSGTRFAELGRYVQQDAPSAEAVLSYLLPGKEVETEPSFEP